jgi:hypothetical protein
MESVTQVLVILPVLLVSVVLHEVAHGWVAWTEAAFALLRWLV